MGVWPNPHLTDNSDAHAMWAPALFYEIRLSVAKLQGRPLNKQMLLLVRISPRTEGKDTKNFEKKYSLSEKTAKKSRIIWKLAK